MNLFKKITAGVALTALLYSIVPAGVFAYDSDEVEAANKLAALNVIVDHSSNVSSYNLDSTVLRQEVAAVARGLADLDKKTTCNGSFSDVSATTPNDWACYSIEALLDNGLIAANATFEPEKTITKSEALGMMVKASDLGYTYDEMSTTMTWQEQLLNFAVSNGLVDSFSDFNTPATRGWIFKAGANSFDAKTSQEDVMDEDDLLSDLLNDLLGDTGDTDTGDTGTGDTGTGDTDTGDTDTGDTDTGDMDNGVTDGVLEVSLSPMTPSVGWVAADTPRTKILAFDLSAGSEDVTLDEVRLDYTGLSNYGDIDEVALYIGSTKISKGSGKNFNDKYIEISFENDTVIMAGQTKTIYVTAKVTGGTDNVSHQITLTDLTASTSVISEGGISSRMFTVVNATNVSDIDLNIDKVTGSDIKIGEEIKLAEFDLEEKNDNEDVILESLTFELKGSMDHQDDLSDITLYVDGEVLASDLTINNDEEIVVDLDYTIPADERFSFMLKGVVVGSVSETLSVDLTEIYAVGAETGISSSISGDAYGEVASSRNIEGSEINVAFDKSDIDEAKPDAEEVSVGKLTLQSDGSYNIAEIEVKVEASAGKNVDDIIKRFELDGKTADSDLNLTANIGYFYFEDLYLNNETLELPLTFDVVDDQTLNGENVKFTVKINEVEDEDNNETYTSSSTPNLGSVLSTNSLDDNTIDITIANATFSSKSVNPTLLVLGNGVQTIAYKGTVNVGDADSINISSFNLVEDAGSTLSVDLDDVIDSAELSIGGYTFNADVDADSVDFDPNIDIEAGASNVDVLVTIFLKDNDSVAANEKIILKVDTLTNDVEDSDGNDITLNVVNLNTNLVTTELLDEGTFALKVLNDEDTDDNLENTVLAGQTNVVLAELEMEAEYEDVDVNEVLFKIAGDFSDTLDEVRIQDGSTVLATSSSIVYDGVSDTVITFDDDFIIYDADNLINAELVADLNNITGESGKTSADAGNIIVKAVPVLDIDAKGDSSNNDLTTDVAGSVNAETVSVVPSIVTVSLVDSLNSTTTPRFKLTADAGGNTDTSNESIDSVIEEVKFSTLGTTDTDTSLTYQLVNIDDSTDIVNGVLVGTTLTFDFTGMGASNKTVEDGKSETYKIVITGGQTDDDTLQLTLPRDGVTYGANGTTGIVVDMTSEMDFGSRSY